jgi:hypothetical protein
MDKSEGGETRLEMAERHAAEGRDRLRRQRALIKKLQRDGHDRMLPGAHQLLADMERLQQEFEEHAADERRHSSGPS